MKTFLSSAIAAALLSTGAASASENIESSQLVAGIQNAIEKVQEQSTLKGASLNRSQISAKFQSLAPFDVLAVEQSPVSSMYQIVTEQGVFYMTKDGEHLVSGVLHKAEPGLPNLTEQRVAQAAAQKIDELRDSFITYKAPNEKYEILVFYDTTCPFCHRLHNDLQSYLDAGITVHYAGYPRDGLRDRRNPGPDSMPNPSVGYSELMGVWCDANPREMLDANAQGARVRPAACRNKIAEHFALGQILGVRGTPAVYSLDGRQVVGGYAPVQGILAGLESLQ